MTICGIDITDPDEAGICVWCVSYDLRSGSLDQATTEDGTLEYRQVTVIPTDREL